MAPDKFILIKIIYCKRKALTKEEIWSILSLEINTHKHNNPGIEFDKIGSVVTNEDRSMSYELKFKPATLKK